MMTHRESREIWRLIRPIKVAMLTTHCGSVLRARPVQSEQERFDGTLWFVVSECLARANGLCENNPVRLAYVDHVRDIYVSLSGTANLL